MRERDLWDNAHALEYTFFVIINKNNPAKRRRIRSQAVTIETQAVSILIVAGSGENLVTKAMLTLSPSPVSSCQFCLVVGISSIPASQ